MKNFLRWLFSLWLFLFMSGMAKASESPLLTISSNTLSSKNQFIVNLKNAPSGSYLRPRVSRGNVKIFNPALDKWVTGNNLWSFLPQMHKDIRIQIEGIDQYEVKFFMDVLDSETFEVVRTMPKSIWGAGFYKNYWEKINSLLRDKMAQ